MRSGKKKGTRGTPVFKLAARREGRCRGNVDLATIKKGVMVAEVAHWHGKSAREKEKTELGFTEDDQRKGRQRQSKETWGAERTGKGLKKVQVRKRERNKKVFGLGSER